jgi:hypothetical protein
MQRLKPLFFLPIFCLIGTYCYAQSLVSRSRWTSLPITIDGKATEWEKPLGAYDPKTRVMFALLNDSTHLYICIVIPDETNQVKISRGGMGLSFNVKSQKEKFKKTIVYPLGSGGPLNQGENSSFVDGKPNMKLFQTIFQLNNTLKRLEGFSGKKELVDLKDSLGIQVAIGWDSLNTMEYELALPLKRLFETVPPSEIWNKELQMEVTIFGLGKTGIKDKDMEEFMKTPNPMSGSRNQNVADMNNQSMTNPMGQTGNGMPINMAPTTGAFYKSTEKGPLYEKASFKWKFELSGKNN